MIFDCMFELKTPQPVLVEVKHKRKEIGFVRFDVFAAVFNFFSNVTLSLNFMLLHLIPKNWMQSNKFPFNLI